MIEEASAKENLEEKPPEKSRSRGTMKPLNHIQIQPQLKNAETKPRSLKPELEHVLSSWPTFFSNEKSNRKGHHRTTEDNNSNSETPN